MFLLLMSVSQLSRPRVSDFGTRAWYAFHTIAEIKCVHSSVTIATTTFKYTINPPPIKVPGHKNLTPTFAMTTQL